MKKYLLFAVVLLWAIGAVAGKPIKVACVGNSITYGVGVENRDTESYPAQLQQLLGTRYEVGNFGRSGATLLYKGHRPYVKQPEFGLAKRFAADIVVIHLGVNDTDPRDWPNYRDDFVKDYLSLIDSFRVANSKCRILIARMTPISNRHPRFESGTRDWHAQIQLAIERVAADAHVQLIDFHEPLYQYPFMQPDGIHPNKEGAGLLAHIVYSAITGNYGGLQLSEIYSDNMVLQRGQPLHFHGLADAGEKVTVAIAGQKVLTRASSDGKWEAVIQPLKAGGPYTLSINTPKRSYSFQQILVGEVWLCSGQSNMEFMLRQSAAAKKAIAVAANDNIRLFDMKARWRTDNVEWNNVVLDSLNHLQYYRSTKWEICSPTTASSFSAVAYYFGKMLQDSLKVPIGLICNAVGGSPTESWIDRTTLEDNFPAILKDWSHNDFIQDWVRQRASTNIKQSTNELQRHPYQPCYLFEAGILPLAKYDIKGVVWYQGESNAQNPDTHSKLFNLLVTSWRKYWGNDAMPFYYVQLSSLNRPSWPWFRDSQRRFLSAIPHLGMAVSSDYGDSLNVHPTFKQPVGERLARWALHDTYGFTAVTPSGPLFRSAEYMNGAAYVRFDYGNGLHASDGKQIIGFEVAEDSDFFYPAKAEVVDGKLKVYSDAVKSPKYIRYGWQPFTRANLVNGDNLPASTFKSY
jgi:sialate O-acetylesterase